jgi:LuxR family maltose regulon positive regulatory protein
MRPRRPPLGKTTRPSVAGILPRRRLFGLLDRARERGAIWVTGPPGCGKTTAVASYLDHARIPCLWYQLDEGDADAASFFYYLGVAASGLGEGDAGPLPLFTPEYHGGLAVFTRRWFEQLHARLEAPFAMVFDGWQEVPVFSPLNEVMREALAARAPGITMILISRTDPPPALARVRASRALALLGWNELRLTPEETASIAARQRPDLPRETLVALYDKTQGWAAGLVLMLERARGEGAMPGAPDLATRELVFDYLAGEAFDKRDPHTQAFLLATAHLPRMSAEMAAELSGEANAATILSALHRDNHFVTLRQVGPQALYQYHPLFREFLLARAARALPKERRRALQRQAAAIAERAGHAEDAVALLRDSHEWDGMARVIAAGAEAMLRQGRGETLARWIEDLPPEVRARHAWMVYWEAAAKAQLAPREGRLLYERGFELFRAQDPPDRSGMALAASGAMDAILYELDDFSLLDRWIEVLDAAVREGAGFASPAVEARVACSMFISLTLRQPQRRDIEQWIERALACSQREPDANLRIYVGLLAALTLMWTGLYARAEGLIAAMRRAAAGPDVSTFSILTLKNIEAMYGMLTARGEAALAAMREGLEIASASGVHTWTFQLLVNGYGGALGIGDLDAAARIVPRLEEHAGRAGRADLCLYQHFRAWEAMLRRDPVFALREERAALRRAVEVGCPYFEVLCRLALAEILAECGDVRKSIVHLQALRPMVEAINNRHLEFTCLTVVGRLALEHGRTRPGLNALRRGLALGREYGYAHYLWWRPEAAARACVHALEAGIETDYVKSLIRARSLAPEQAPLAVQGWPWMFRVSTFGGFRLLRQDAPLASGAKAQRRPLELLKALIACGGERVNEEHLAAALWPRVEGDSAHRSFTSALHRLRKLLGEDRALVLHDGRLTLDRRYFWLDLWAFEDAAGELEGVLRQSRAPAEEARVERLAERLLALYRGPFLAGEPEESWLLPRRERARAQFARAMTEVGRWREGRGEHEHALGCYEKCLEADPLAEAIYRRLMLLYQRLDRRAEAIETWHRCRRVLAALGVEPSAETRALYEKLS